MTKYITIENEIFEATLILSTSKTNDEFVPKNRKIGSAGDKNHFLVNTNLYNKFGNFFPLILEDKREGQTNRNNETIKNYFSISNILNDLDLVNNKINKDYPKEETINIKEFSNLIFSKAKEENLNINFYIESQLSSANNGIGFKNWSNPFSSTIKLLLLHNTRTNVYLFKKDDGEICSYFEFNQNYLQEQVDILNSSDVFDKGSNIIYYGAPGTGKSHKVKEIVFGKDERTERITFHPEYDYTSFVGGYKPTMGKDEDGKEVIKYEFVAQAFTNIYVKAWNSNAEGKDEDFYLVIEEINRGNCAEIFGDIFQLLDRTNDYKITPSKELKEYLNIKLKDNSSVDADKLLLPPNLNILATMNTSDQSLFPMDSAFKRRWDWEYIPINYEATYINSKGDEKENESANYLVTLPDDSSFKWLDFIKSVNNNWIRKNENLGMDKCLGNYFIKSNTKEITLNTFINKAVFYLWNDVFKDEMEEKNIFKDKTTYEDFFPIETDGLSKVKEILEILEVEVKPT